MVAAVFFLCYKIQILQRKLLKFVQISQKQKPEVVIFKISMAIKFQNRKESSLFHFQNANVTIVDMSITRHHTTCKLEEDSCRIQKKVGSYIKHVPNVSAS